MPPSTGSTAPVTAEASAEHSATHRGGHLLGLEQPADRLVRGELLDRVEVVDRGAGVEHGRAGGARGTPRSR